MALHLGKTYEEWLETYHHEQTFWADSEDNGSQCYAYERYSPTANALKARSENFVKKVEDFKDLIPGFPDKHSYTR